jgi:hypothetical protein
MGELQSYQIYPKLIIVASESHAFPSNSTFLAFEMCSFKGQQRLKRSLHGTILSVFDVA